MPACHSCERERPDNELIRIKHRSGNTSFRCVHCNRVPKRVYDTLNSEDMGQEKVAWKKFTPEQKKTFYDDNCDVMLEELPAKLRTYITEVTTDFGRNELGKYGNFLDKEDLDKKYADKPAQLAAIYKNARTMVCEVRECQLWEDPEYKSAEVAGSSWETTKKREVAQEDNNFKKKAKLPPREPKEPKPPKPDPEKELTDKQKAQLEALKKKVQAVLQRADKAANALETNQDLKAYVPTPLQQSIVESVAEANREAVALDMALAAEWKGVFKDVKNDAAAALSNAVASLGKFDTVAEMMGDA